MADVTVVLPVRNGAAYLREAIESVLEQESVDFKLHVLDDGSEDETPAISSAIRDSRVRYSRNARPTGLFGTLNRGFEEAITPLVRIWSHDDRMLPGSLRRFVEFAHRHPSAGMVYCDFYEIDAGGQRTAGDAAYTSQRQRTPELANSELSALLFWLYGCLPGNISTVMLRRCAWEDTGGFLTDFQQAPDFDMWVRVSERWDIGFIRDKLIELRVHSQQLSRVGQKQMTTIEEESPIIRRLDERVMSVLTRQERRKCWRAERGRQHIHWIARAILRGDLSAAARGWRAVRGYGQPWGQVLFWLVSANGRFFAPNRDEFFDSKVRLLKR